MFLYVFLFFSCGPRSGINTSENTETEKNTIWCGNGVMETQNYARASNTLKISGDGNHGKKLFKQNCAVCHSLLDQKLSGPGLKGIYDHVPEPKTQWLKKYIVNSDSISKSGHPYSKKLRTEYQETSMTNFKGLLTDQDINDLLIYIIANTN